METGVGATRLWQLHVDIEPWYGHLVEDNDSNIPRLSMAVSLVTAIGSKPSPLWTYDDIKKAALVLGKVRSHSASCKRMKLEI